jgi:hypothetical protein
MTDFALPLPAPARARAETFVPKRRRTASFGDLVLAHWRWKGTDDDDHERERYETTRQLFEAEHGKIVDDYWPAREGTGVALCCKPDRWGRKQWSLHRSMGNLAAGHADFSPLLLLVAGESVRASNILCGMTQRIAVANLFALSRDIMASLAAEGHGPTGLEAYNGNLHEISRSTGEAGARQAQVIYLKGLMWGLLALVALAPLLGLALPSAAVPGMDTKLFVGCLVAGSFGATMSVLIRMSGGNFKVNHEVGRGYVTNLGFARPYIGAIFALLLYFASQGGLLQQIQIPESPGGEFAFFIATGFLIGFSERLAKEIVRTAESGTGATQSEIGGAVGQSPAEKASAKP